MSSALSMNTMGTPHSEKSAFVNERNIKLSLSNRGCEVLMQKFREVSNVGTYRRSHFIYTLKHKLPVYNAHEMLLSLYNFVIGVDSDVKLKFSKVTLVISRQFNCRVDLDIF